MVEQRHYTDQLILGVFQAESSYGVPLSTFDATTATAMVDCDDASVHEVWDDTVVGEGLIRLGATLPDAQALALASMRLTYTEPRVKLHTLTALVGLALGQVTSVQQRYLNAWRHQVTLARPTLVPSISALTGHMRNRYSVYGGIKSDGFTLRNNGPYLTFTCPLIGAGTKTDVTPVSDVPPAIEERWLRWGDCHLYVADVTATPLHLPDPPVQGGTQLGETAIEVSSRVLACSVQHQNGLGAQNAYRVATDRARSNFYAAQRQTTLQLTLEVDTATEAEELTWYLTQRRLAFEWVVTSATEIDPVTITALTVGTPPDSWTVTDSDGGTWYVSPDPRQQLLVDTVAPAGTGLVVGLGLELLTLDGWRYRIGVDPQGELTTERTTHVGTSPHGMETCALRDGEGTSWTLWVEPHDDIGEIVVSADPIPVVPWRAGFSLVCPRVQWTKLERQQEQQLDTLVFTGTVLEDGVHDDITLWTYNAIPAYLQGA